MINRSIMSICEEMSIVRYSVFPAYGQLFTELLPIREATIYLRTVIVTAAVYWGLSSKLRSPTCVGPLTSPLDLPAPGRSQSLYIIL